MKIAFIPPFSLLRYTEQTNYQLCLPHLFAYGSYKVKYHKYCQDEDQFVILDNGAAEGALASIDELMKNAIKLRPDEVVIPDVLGDKQATINSAVDFYHQAVPPIEMRSLPFGFMFVVQGQTFQEVIDCAQWACEQEWVDTIGIPRHLLTTLDDDFARVRVANTIQGLNYCKQIHFLGANGQFPQEVSVLANPQITSQDRVRGMDTSMPFNYAYHNLLLIDTNAPAANRPEHYFHSASTRFDADVVDMNVKYFLQFHEQGVGAE